MMSVTVEVVEPGHCVVNVESESLADRDHLLTNTLFLIVEFLKSLSTSRPEQAVVDIRLSRAAGSRGLPNSLAFYEAVRGLVQSFTLEEDPLSPPTNVLLSGTSDSVARNLTLNYLSQPHGGFARGASFDVRGEEK